MLQDTLAFIRTTCQFQAVERAILIPGQDRWENDAEHSYQLVMLAWYLIEKYHFKLDKDEVLKLALVHDWVEIHAGDTFFYADTKTLASKKAREAEAMEKLKQQFPDFPSLHNTIERYENLESPESRFVYALDKVIPILNIYLDGGRVWRKMNISLDTLHAAKRDKVTVSPEVKPLYDELVSLLKESPNLFPPRTASVSQSETS